MIQPLQNNIQKNWFYILAITFLGAITWLHFSSVNNELNGLGGDNAGYILLAQSLAEGKGYADWGPGAPPHTHFPPLFPLLLAPFVKAFGINYKIIHSVVVVCELIAVVLLFCFFTYIANKKIALFACLTLALNPFVNLSLVRVLTEFPYLLLTALVLFITAREDVKSTKMLRYFWIPMLIVCCYYTRTAGLSILLAYIIYRFIRKEFRLLCITLPLLIGPRILWMLYINYSGGTESYMNWLWLKSGRDSSQGMASLADIFDRISVNFVNILHGVSNFIVPIDQKPGFFLLLFLSIIICFGIFKRLQNRKTGLMEYYVMVYVGMLLVWPIYEPRKLMVIIPFIYFYFFSGIHYAGLELSSLKHISPRIPLWSSWGTFLLSLIIVTGQPPLTIALTRIRATPIIYPQLESTAYDNFSLDWSHFRESYYWFKNNSFYQGANPWANYLYISHLAGKITPEGSALLARKASITALYSHRPATVYLFTRDVELQKKHILEKNIDYLIYDGMFSDTMQFINPLVKAYPTAFKLARQQGNASLVQVLRSEL